KVGARGGSDSHQFQVGNGDTTICFARELTRDAILDAMRSNLCYFASRYPIDLRFSIEGSPMGSTIAGRTGMAASAVAATAWQTDLARIRLLRDGEVLDAADCDPATRARCDLASRLPEAPAGYYYVEILSSSGAALAISSPIWVTAAR